MTQVVTYDYATWIAQFPEFSGCSSAQGQNWFNRAGLFFQNDVCNPAYGICSDPSAGQVLMASLLYLLTSHLAFMYAPRDANGNPSSSGTPAAPIVGRINSASEGSVSVGAEWNAGGSPSEAFFIQTRYGAEFWQATAQFRTMRYSARPTVVPGTGFPYFGGYVRVPRRGF